MLDGLTLAFLLVQLGLSAGDTSLMQNCYSGINLDSLEFGPPLLHGHDNSQAARSGPGSALLRHWFDMDMTRI